MEEMFSGAASFAHNLCGAWITSTANKDGMFDRSFGRIFTATPNRWAAKSELQAAIKECLQLSSDCSKGPHGPIGSWDVSAVTDMSQLFNRKLVPGANKFTGDISNWDVSGVTTMFG